MIKTKYHFGLLKNCLGGQFFTLSSSVKLLSVACKFKYNFWDTIIYK